MTWGSLAREFSPDGIGRVTLIVGVVIICYRKLSLRVGATEEAYKLGYDIGFENGDHEGRAERPVVVGLASRRCGCKTSQDEAFAHTGKVADHV